MANNIIRDVSKIRQLIDFDDRLPAFKDIMRYINAEMVEGDIIEFGVGVGNSLLMFASIQYDYINKVPEWLGDQDFQPFDRKIVGFDSFEGLPSDEGHARWRKGFFGTNYRIYHPFLKLWEKLKPEYVVEMFESCDYPAPILEVGLFKDTVAFAIPKKYSKAAIVHIDCDLYESTKIILDVIEPTLQQGTIIMFDDWFAFKGAPNKGEAKAFHEFLEANTHIQAIEFHRYSAYGKAFLIHKGNIEDGLQC